MNLVPRSLWIALGWTAALSASATPTRTPTPGPRLLGGFGRAAATPSPAAPRGQGLADVVRAASDARRRTPKPGVAITNESLVTDPKRGRLSTAQAVPPRTTPAATPAATSAVPGTEALPEPDAAEAEWRETARRARGRVEEARTNLARLESEAKKLESDFYSWDDGQYRDSVIKPAWDKKREETETARRELAAAEKDLADLPERARKAGALPGWIRE